MIFFLKALWATIDIVSMEKRKAIVKNRKRTRDSRYIIKVTRNLITRLNVYWVISGSKPSLEEFAGILYPKIKSVISTWSPQTLGLVISFSLGYNESPDTTTTPSRTTRTHMVTGKYKGLFDSEFEIKKEEDLIELSGKYLLSDIATRVLVATMWDIMKHGPKPLAKE